MTDALQEHEGTVSIGGRTVTNLRFADDIDGLAGREEELKSLVERIDKTSERLRHGDQCPEDQADDQRQRHQCRNQDRRSEARNSEELQIPGVHCYRPGFKA